MTSLSICRSSSKSAKTPLSLSLKVVYPPMFCYVIHLLSLNDNARFVLRKVVLLVGKVIYYPGQKWIHRIKTPSFVHKEWSFPLSKYRNRLRFSGKYSTNFSPTSSLDIWNFGYNKTSEKNTRKTTGYKTDLGNSIWPDKPRIMVLVVASF